MISTELAAALRDTGLVWHPASGDRFQLNEPEFDADVFTVSEMTIEPRSYSTGTILAFNGTTEWALDSVALGDALWLPREDQLRELLLDRFRSLVRLPDTYRVEIDLRGERRAASIRSPRTPTRSPCWRCCAASSETARHPLRLSGFLLGVRHRAGYAPGSRSSTISITPDGAESASAVLCAAVCTSIRGWLGGSVG